MSSISGTGQSAQHIPQDMSLHAEQVVTENTEASSVANKKATVESKRLSPEILTKAFDMQNQQAATAEGGLTVMSYLPTVSSDRQVDIEILSAFIESAPFQAKQSCELEMLQKTLMMAQDSISFGFLMGPMAGSIENENARNQAFKLLTMLDSVMHNDGDGALIDKVLMSSEENITLKAPKENAPDLKGADAEKAAGNGQPAISDGALGFRVNIFDKGSKLALLMMATHLQFRQSNLDMASSLVKSRQAISDAHRAGILTRGEQAFANTIASSMVNIGVSVGGAGTSIKGGATAHKTQKDFNAQAPEIKGRVEQLKAEIQTEMAGENRPTVLAELNEKLNGADGKGGLAQTLEGLEIGRETAAYQQGQTSIKGQLYQNLAGSTSGIVASTGQLTDSINEAENLHSQTTADMLKEIMDSVKSAQAENQTQLQSLISMLGQFNEMTRGLYASL